MNGSTAAFARTDPGERKVFEFRATVLRLYLLIAVGASVAVIPAYFFIGIEPLTAICVAYGLGVVALTVMQYRAHLDVMLLSRLFLAATIGACMGGLYLGNELIDNKPWQLLLPLVAFPLLGTREAWGWVVGIGALALGIFYVRGTEYEILSVLVFSIAFATMAVSMAAFSTFNENNIRAIAHLSHTDPLTGTYNRQLFDELSLNVFNRSRRAQEPLAVYMIDIDNFKQYNDRYGHVAGDTALARVAQVIRGSARRGGDLVFRYGGEEFCVVSSGSDLADARRLATSIIDNVRALSIPHVDASRGFLTVSIGLSHHEQLAEQSAESVLHQADTALYEAKMAGRDQLVQRP